MSLDLLILIFLTSLVLILLPIYWKNYGPQNFLWLSDIGLFITVLALWFKSDLLISFVSVGLLPLEILWNLDFFIHLFSGYNLCGLASYMFENKYSNVLKGLSLFHVFLPIIWIYYLLQWGYKPNAFKCFIILLWLILSLSLLISTKKENINWVFKPEKYEFNQLFWLVILYILFPLFITFPLHLIFLRLFLP